MDTFEILTQYGVLGIWVLYAITRERWLLRKIEEISARSKLYKFILNIFTILL
jgi:hypothetical protein